MIQVPIAISRKRKVKGPVMSDIKVKCAIILSCCFRHCICQFIDWYLFSINRYFSWSANRHYRWPFCSLCQRVSFWPNILACWRQGMMYSFLWLLSTETRRELSRSSKARMVVKGWEGTHTMGIHQKHLVCWPSEGTESNNIGYTGWHQLSATLELTDF